MGQRYGHVELPLDFDEDEGWLSVGPIGQAVAVRCLAAAARNLTDGCISAITFKRLTVDITAKQAAQAAKDLARIGFWASTPDGSYQVVDWEQYAWTRRHVEEYRADQAGKARSGGIAREAHARRDAQGRMTGAPVADDQPDLQPAGLDTDQPDAQPTNQPGSSPDTDTVANTDAHTGLRPRASGPGTSDNESFFDIPHDDETDGSRSLGSPSVNATSDGDVSAIPRATGPSARPPGMATGQGIGATVPDAVSPGTGVRTGRRGKRYDPAWPKASERSISGWETERCRQVRRAWEARGLKKLPTEKQWQYLAGVNDRDAEALAALIQDAPPGQSNEVYGWVLDRINADPRLKSYLAAGPTEEGRAREHRCPRCDAPMREGITGGYRCRWHGVPEGTTRAPAPDARPERDAEATEVARDLGDDAPICECGKRKVARPNGSGWVCTNPFGHGGSHWQDPASGIPNEVAAEGATEPGALS